MEKTHRSRRVRRPIVLDIPFHLFEPIVITKSRSRADAKPKEPSEGPEDSISSTRLVDLPVEILLQIFGYLKGGDMWCVKDVCERLRNIVFAYELVTVLKDDQKKHVEKSKEILAKHRCLVDNSDRGLGKSVITSALASDTGRSLTIVTEKTVGPQFYEVASSLGNKDVDVVSYAFLRKSNKYFEFKKVDKTSKSGSVKRKSVCVPTPLWIERCKRGTLLCFDESQALKNNSVQFKGALCLAREVHRHEKSAIELASATFSDKAESISNYAKILGLIQSEKLSSYHVRHGYVLKGAKEFLDNCRDKFGMTPAEHAFAMINFRKGKHRLLLDVFSKYIVKTLFVAMPPIDFDVVIRNVFYDLSKRCSDVVGDAVRRMAAVMSRYPVVTAQVRAILNGIASNSEAAKIESAALRFAHLLGSSNKKIVVVMNGLTNIARMAKLTEEYGSVVIQGETSLPDRTKRIARFQRHDDSCRVIIGQIQCLGAGINLHDTGKGDDSRPRHVFIFPSFNGTMMHQAAARVTRRFMTSRAHVDYVYAKGHDAELQIIDAISRRDSIRRQLTHENNVKVKFPSEHDRVYE